MSDPTPGIYEGVIEYAEIGVTKVNEATGKGGHDYIQLKVEVDRKKNGQGDFEPCPKGGVSTRMLLTDGTFEKFQAAERLAACGYAGGELNAESFKGNRMKIIVEPNKYDNKIFLEGAGFVPKASDPKVSKKIMAKFGDKLKSAAAKAKKPEVPQNSAPPVSVSAPAVPLNEDDIPF